MIAPAAAVLVASLALQGQGQAQSAQGGQQAQTPPPVQAVRAAPTKMVEEYFPLRPGDEYVYMEEASRIRTTFVDRIGQPVEIGGRTAFPITTLLAGQAVLTSYFAYEGDAVVNVAIDPKQPFASPYPIFRVGDKAIKWEFVGTAPVGETSTMIQLKAESRRTRTRDLLGARRETVQVAITFESADGVRTKQVATYAAGIGLVDLEDNVQVGRIRSKRTRKLVEFRPAPAAPGPTTPAAGPAGGPR